MSGNVKCPVHGEHGNLSNGKCWYCVQAGMTPAAASKPIPIRQPGTMKRIF